MEPAPVPTEATHNHTEDKVDENKDSWNNDNHGGMSRSELMEYAIKLDKDISESWLAKILQMSINTAFVSQWLNMQYAFDFYHLNDIPGLSIAKVQCAETQPKCFHYMRDQAFPTIVLFYNGHYVEELFDRDHVWDYIQKQSEIVKESRFEEYTSKFTSASLVTELKDEQLEIISPERLEMESIGGTDGIMRTVTPVGVSCYGDIRSFGRGNTLR
ncbi:hypothetical protein HDU84_004523 [Entophlyctis sp. JEL0112]|nr:hypothetical protein HDU84_004523 [Entophlyctis sp. JEL0112]